MATDSYRWKYGRLALIGDWLWAKIADPVLRFIVGGDDLTSFQHIRRQSS